MEAQEQFPFTVDYQGKSTALDKQTLYLQLRLHLTPTTDKKLVTINYDQHILIVLDRSGSMSGSPLNNSKTGIEQMVKFLKQNNLNNISLIVYDTVAQTTDFHKLDLPDCLAAIGKINAGGGTTFRSAFLNIVESVKLHHSTDVKVIFFTDGEDGSAKASLNVLSDFFKNVPQSEFHTIGFRENHDVDLLSKITTIGSRPGTFQYCKEAKDIQTCVESVSGLIACASFVNGVVVDGLKHESPLDLDPFNDEEAKVKQFKTTLFVDLKINPETLLLRLTAGKATQDIQVVLKNLKADEENSNDPSFLHLYFIKHRIGQALQRALKLREDKGGINKELLNELVKEVESYNAKLDELSIEGNKMATKQKKEFFPQLFETKDLVAEFYSKLKDFQSGQINNDKVAALNALAYRKVTKKGLQRKLDARTQNNVGVINKAYDIVKQATSKMDFKQLQEKYGALADKIGCCVLSASNFIEALKQDDCLCLTYDVGRSQAAIMDPTQIVIKQVFPTYITVSSFLFSAEYALKANSEAHGGFEKKAQGEIVKGIARESITGVLPLYICPENWTVAKQLMKPALGWTVTLDPLGYAFAQVKTVPFMVLCKLYNMPPSEFKDFQIQLVQDTCMQIIKDASNPKNQIRLNQQLTTQFNNYLKDPLSRTIDIITNNQVFLTQLYLLSKMKMLELPGKGDLQKFFQLVEEEEMRRCTLAFEPTVDAAEVLLPVLNTDMEREVNEPVRKAVETATGGGKKYTGFAEKFKAALGADYKDDGVKNQKPNIEKAEDKKEEWKYRLSTDGKFNHAQLAAVTELEESRKRASRVTSLKRLFGLDYHNDKLELTEDNMWTLIGLYVQNKITAKNADRREYITQGKFKNIFQNSEQAVIALHDRFVEQVKSSRVSKALADVKSNAFTEAANAFHDTHDLHEAAGALMGVRVGSGVSYFSDALARPGVPLLAEKVKMLMDGRYKGVPLLTDRGGNMEWHFSRHRGNNILRANKDAYDAMQWKKVLPMVHPEFLHKFLAGKAT